MLARLTIRDLPHENLCRGRAALEIPWEEDSFENAFRHGASHHVPEIRPAQAEIWRMLRPGSTLVAMLYARHSLNYLVSIRVLHWLDLLCALGFRQHLVKADSLGLRVI